VHCADDGIIEWLQRREQRGAKSGGLLSYGTSLGERERQAVLYAGRILIKPNCSCNRSAIRVGHQSENRQGIR
jgi:hypothetical protein